MSSVYPWIYVDYRNNVWKFFRDDNKELCYKIMYGEGKWTKENIIDKDVLGFAVYVGEDETIHIVYSNVEGALKYCTMKNKQWVGKIIHQMENYESKIQNLKVQIIGSEMHIFYLLIDNDGSDHGVLMHCMWNGNETEITALQDIIVISSLKEHYLISINEDNNIEVFFITDEGDEVSLNYCSFQNSKWSTGKRLYGIQGEDVAFEVLRNEQEIHILNKSREDSIHFLDHVCIDISGDIQEFKVYKSSKELVEPILFTKSNRLYSCWLEQDKIFYSVFEDEKWSDPLYYDRGNELKLRQYSCFICSDGESSIKFMQVYGTNGEDFYLFIPNQFVVSANKLSKCAGNQTTSDIIIEEKVLKSLKIELAQVKSEKKALEKKFDSLNIQLQKKQRFIKDYEERIAIILEQKRKSDINYKVFLELHQNIQKELEDTNQKLLEERKIKTDIENKLKKCEEENKIIKQQVDIMSKEKKKLYEELELEKNQSIMDRLLRKRPSGI